MAKQGKRLAEVYKGLDRDKAYELTEAVQVVKDCSKAKFDESVEISMNLGVDPRHADQMVRGMVALPRTANRWPCSPAAKADEAKAGAEIVGAEDLTDIQNGKMDFDRVIATPDMMALVGRLGKILGPRGDAEPELGTCAGCGRCGVGRQGRSGGVPGREGGHRARRHRQGELPQSRRQRQRVRQPGQAVRCEGHLREEDFAQLHPGAGREVDASGIGTAARLPTN